ncbi:MAG: hypothetical protein UZ08_BCD001001743 [Candidatus Parvibacillus calidus]|nr:MAG: hypothetical protein UZ08_BCD001001743 [Candidatus Parvibacillus calidus]
MESHIIATGFNHVICFRTETLSCRDYTRAFCVVLPVFFTPGPAHDQMAIPVLYLLSASVFVCHDQPECML